MEEIYNYILDNIYIFCLLLILVFVLIIFVVYLFKSDKEKNEEEIKDETVKPKEELEKISDEEIEQRVIEEYKEETKALDDKLDKLKENYKDNSSVEQIIDSLKDAKEKTTSEALRKYEEEQEEQAIISYQQLVAAVKGEDAVPSKKDIEEDIDTKRLLEKYENLNYEIDEEPVVKKEEKIDYSYKPNEFISPVFGRMDSSKVHYREGLSYTDKAKKEEYPAEEFNDDYKHVSRYFNEDNKSSNEEFKPRSTKLDSEEFLRNLKEFRKNL